jgi:hypothetical protein
MIIFLRPKGLCIALLAGVTALFAVLRELVDLGELRERRWPFLGGIAKQNGIMPRCLGGVADQVHLLLSLPSTVPIAKAILIGTDQNGAKIRAVWDFFCPGGAVGLSPGFQPWETSKKAVRPARARDHVGPMRPSTTEKEDGIC